MVVASILPHAEFGPNYHSEDAPTLLNSPRNNLYITGESRLCYRVVVQGQTMNFMSLGQVKDTLENVPIKYLVEKSNLC